MRNLLIVAALAVFAVVGRAQEPVFVAHPAVVESALSPEQVKNILLGTKTRWDSGPVIKLVILTRGEVNDAVIRDYTQRSADQFDKFWKKQVFSGKGAMPATGGTDAEILAFVAANPGAFGYIDKSSVTPAVKVIAVE